MRKSAPHRRRYALVNPIKFAMEGAAIISDDALKSLHQFELTAIECFRTGTARRQEWMDIADMLNICETMAEAGIGPEALESCRVAQQALSDAHERHHAYGAALTLRGPELVALRDAWEFHDLQRRSIPRADYERYIKRTHDRIRSAHPSVKVCPA